MTFSFVTNPETVQIPLAWVAIVVGTLATALVTVFKLYLKSQKQLLEEKEEKYLVLAVLKAKAEQKKRNGTDRIGS